MHLIIKPLNFPLTALSVFALFVRQWKVMHKKVFNCLSSWENGLCSGGRGQQQYLTVNTNKEMFLNMKRCPNFNIFSKITENIHNITVNNESSDVFLSFFFFFKLDTLHCGEAYEYAMRPRSLRKAY